MRSWGASLGTGGWARATNARVAAHHRPHEDGGEEHASRADGLRVDGRAAVEGAERAHEDDGDRVVEHLHRATPRLAVTSARSRRDLGAISMHLEREVPKAQLVIGSGRGYRRRLVR